MQRIGMGYTGIECMFAQRIELGIAGLNLFYMGEMDGKL
jgi:hypothetical protein